MKRGVVNSSGLWSWLDGVRGDGALALRTVLITLRDETRQPVTRWKIHAAKPVRWIGPTLTGKGSGDVAIEELVLSAENTELVPPK